MTTTPIEKQKKGFALLSPERLTEVRQLGIHKGGKAKVAKGFATMSKEKLATVIAKSTETRRRNRDLKQPS